MFGHSGYYGYHAGAQTYVQRRDRVGRLADPPQVVLLPDPVPATNWSMILLFAGAFAILWVALSR